jgi:serine protease
MATRRTTSTRPDSAKAIRHNLEVLNGGRRALTLAPSLTELERERGLRFVVRTRNRPRPETIERAILAEHGLAVEAEPLFRTIDAGEAADAIGRRYLLTLPGLSRRDVAVNPFELGYQLAATSGLEIEAVEPDLPHSAYAGNVTTDAFGFAAGIPLCNVDEDESLPKTWNVENTHVLAAQTLAPAPSGKQLGEGIVIGHPDTGWVVHDELDAAALDTSKSFDFVDGDNDATDPLTKPWLSIGFLGNPGHGLGTGSVIVSGPGGLIKGVAPAATLVPIRTVTKVWQVFTADLARGIEWATNQGCHVISMSLGGTPSDDLQLAVNTAVKDNIIFCGAAGNCVHFVVAPGLYPNAVGVAASNFRDEPWLGSCRGPAVDITSPGENVWVARRKKGESGTARVGQSQGTSPATALVAGVAALWLAHHGRDALIAKYDPVVKLQHVFLHLLRQTARQVPGWDTSSFGPGIVDAEKLLKAQLPEPADVAATLPADPFRMLTTSEVIALMLGESAPSLVEVRLAADLGAAGAGAVVAEGVAERNLAKYGPELIHILAENRAAGLQYRNAVRAPALAAPERAVAEAVLSPDAATAELARVASPSLRRALRG